MEQFSDALSIGVDINGLKGGPTTQMKGKHGDERMVMLRQDAKTRYEATVKLWHGVAFCLDNVESRHTRFVEIRRWSRSAGGLQELRGCGVLIDLNL